MIEAIKESLEDTQKLILGAESRKMLRYLLDELEKADKVNENLIDRIDQADRTILSFATSKGMNEDLLKMMQEFDKRYRHSEFDFTKLQTEHTAMKNYLLDLRAETSHDHIASQISNVLSTISKGIEA